MNKKNEIIKVYDMTCNSCEKTVERDLTKLDGVTFVKANYINEEIKIEYDEDLLNKTQITEAIKKSGYSTKDSTTIKIIGIGLVVLAILIFSMSTGGFDMEAKLTNASYLVIFIVGVLTSLHCVGMCGGIMLSQSIKIKGDSKLSALKPTFLYNIGRLTSYTILGFIVGALGSVLSLTIETKAIMQIVAGIFMIIMGLNMFGFKYLKKIKLPWFHFNFKTKVQTPYIVGFLNGLMPCGPLQTMQLYALGTGSATKGALSMFIFALGTIPLMFIFGSISGFLTKGNTKKLSKFSGILVLILGLMMAKRGLSLAGINLSPSNLMRVMNGANQTKSIENLKTSDVGISTIKDGVQTITMTADNNGYTPSVIYVQKNIPIKWIINGKQITSCNGEIVVPSENIEKKLKSGDNILEFVPKDKDINFSCWMGMITGVIKVVDDINTVDPAKVSSVTSPSTSSASCCSPSSSISTTTSSSQQSIYGSDLTLVPTGILINKAISIGNYQSAKFKGIGYEFEPLVNVVNKNSKTKLSFDLTKFNKPEGKYSIVNSKDNATIVSFQGKNGVVEVDFSPSATGEYAVLKDDGLIGGIDVVDNLKTTDLETVRTRYFK